MPDRDTLQKPEISVIIPVYNTEKYVREAVESIINQTFKNLEIIIINDGSTDKSLEIVEELSEMDCRIRIFSQANQGPSIARNTGIANARGKYIYFMDSDDLLEEDAMEICFRQCEEQQLDFVFFDATSFKDGELHKVPQLSYKRTDKFESKIYTGQEAFKTQLHHGVFTASSCLNLISINFLNDRKIRYYPGILHEDQLFLVQLYMNAHRTACIQRSFFHRRIRNNSIMTCQFSDKNLTGYLTVTEKVIDMKKQKTIDKETKETINLYLSQMLNSVVWQAHSLSIAKRLNLAILCLTKYKKYVSNRSIAVLLFKSLTSKRSKTISSK